LLLDGAVGGVVDWLWSGSYKALYTNR
jgi:hypothetical protein